MNFKGKMDLDKIRADTPCINVYMDNSSASIPPRPVIEAIESYFRAVVKHGTKSMYVREHFDGPFINEAKKPIAKLIGASPDEIAFTLNGSDAISIIANGINFKRGDNVVLSELRFICNTVPWLRLRDTHGIEIKIVKANKPGFIDLDHLRSQINDRTKVVAIEHMIPSLGTIQPIKQIAQIAHEKGSLFFLDACNTVGLVNIDVNDIGCDFMAAAGRKYLRGPMGTGFVYVKKDHICDLRPSYIGWKTGTWDWNNDLYKYAETIDRFASGEPNYPGIVGLVRAVEYLDEIGGIVQVEQRVAELTDYILESLASVPGVEVYGPKTAKGRAGLVIFSLRNVPSSQLSQYLNKNGVVVQLFTPDVCPGPLKMFGVNAVVRITLHYFNTKEEIDRVIDLLTKISQKKINKE
jgi:cysteine desulfurase/selenocysteine lyase